MWKISGTLQKPSVGREVNGGGRRHEAGTHDAATAILEVVTGKVPLDVRHRSLPLGRTDRLLSNELRVVENYAARGSTASRFHDRNTPRKARWTLLVPADLLLRISMVRSRVRRSGMVS